PGGVNSPVRACRGVGGEPFFVARREGVRLWYVVARSYLDFIGSWRPLILGHAPPSVVAGVSDAAARATTYGCPTVREAERSEAARSPRSLSSRGRGTWVSCRRARGSSRDCARSRGRTRRC